MKKIISSVLIIAIFSALFVVPSFGEGEKSATVSDTAELIDALDNSESLDEIVLKGGIYRIESGTVIDGTGVVSIPSDDSMYYVKVEGKTGKLFSKVSVSATTGIIVK